jgi:hypothetical protein
MQVCHAGLTLTLYPLSAESLAPYKPVCNDLSEIQESLMVSTFSFKQLLIDAFLPHLNLTESVITSSFFRLSSIFNTPQHHVLRRNTQLLTAQQ